MKSISEPTLSDIAAMLPIVTIEQDGEHIFKIIWHTAQRTIDALLTIVGSHISHSFIEIYIYSWLHTGLALADLKHIHFVYEANMDEVITAYEKLPDTYDDKFTKLILEELTIIEQIRDESGFNDLLLNQLTLTCYRLCEAAFLAKRKVIDSYLINQ